MKLFARIDKRRGIQRTRTHLGCHQGCAFHHLIALNGSCIPPWNHYDNAACQRTERIDIDTQPSVCSIHFGENTEQTNDKSPHNCVTLPEKESSKYGSTGGQKDIVGCWSPEVFPCDKREGADKLYAIYIYKRD